jgi:hypothetical protein
MLAGVSVLIPIILGVLWMSRRYGRTGDEAVEST